MPFDADNVQCEKFYLAPTHMIPNSRYPLIRYRGLVSDDDPTAAVTFYDSAKENGWSVHWVSRYAETQMSHYHSYVHECMIVLNGTAVIRFGAGDLSDDMQANTYGDQYEAGGIELECKKGDVLLIPAGVSHKTHKTLPRKPFKLYSPGDGRHDVPEDFRDELDKLELEGYVMMGCYPKGAGSWDYALGAEGAMMCAATWAVPPPDKDPIFGDSEKGVRGMWTGPPGPYVEGIEKAKLEEKRDYMLHESEME